MNDQIRNLIEESDSILPIFHNISTDRDGILMIKKNDLVNENDVIAEIESNGKKHQIRAKYGGRIFYLIENKTFVKSSTLIAKIQLDLYVDSKRLCESISDIIWNLAISTHSLSKGLMANMNGGGHITDRIIPIKKKLDPEKGLASLIKQICDSLNSVYLEGGEVIVVAEKLLAVSQKRLVPYTILVDPDPKKIDEKLRLELAKKYSKKYKMVITDKDLILADTYFDKKGNKFATIGARDHNRLAKKIADAIKNQYGCVVDVVISDTDTGIDIRYPILGFITIGCSPLGSTAGLTLYECMRVASAAELMRGTNKGIPIVVCKPRERNKSRPNIGSYRGYKGLLSIKKEENIAFA